MSRIGSWLILSFRLHRWEVLASAAGVAILSAAMLWFTGQLRDLAAAEPGCLDPMTYVVVPMLLVAATVGASYLPARRAAAVDPVVALKAE